MSLRKRLLVKPPSGALVPSEHFGVVLYEGDGSSSHSINGGKFGAGANFNGSSSVITLPSALSDGATIDASCISFWFNVGAEVTSSTSNNEIMSFAYSGGSTGKIALGATTGNFTDETFSVSSDVTSQYTYSKTNIPAGWNHAVVQWNSSNTKWDIYVNGVAHTTYTFGTNEQGKFALKFGNRSSYYYNGKLDQIRVFQKVLTSSEVSTLYAETVDTVESLDPLSEDTTDTLQVLGDSSCVATYRFENDEVDLSGNYDGTGTAIQYAAGRYGQAASFNGSSSTIYASKNVFSQPTVFSASCWFNTTYNAQRQTIFGTKGAASTSGFALTIGSGADAGKIQYYEGNGSTNSNTGTSSLTYSDGNWHHIVLTRTSAGAVKVYINGNSTPVISFTPSSLLSSHTYDLGIGSWGAGGSSYFNGKIDQARIFNKAISAAEVTTLYNENPLVASYRFEGNSNDDTRNYDGTASNVTYEYGLGFTPDFVWAKRRSAIEDNAIFDTSRGVQKQITANKTNAESTKTNAISSFDLGGFTTGANNALNTDGEDYVAWCLKANGGTTSSNTDGSITSTVQVNEDAGFSIVSYTGDGNASSTVGHGLGAIPELTIFKTLSGTSEWNTYLTSNNTVGFLNNTTAFVSNNGGTNGSVDIANMSSTTFGFLNGSSSVNNQNGNGSTYIMYAFKSINGFSKIGTYAGNSSTDGPIVETGFEPAFLMIKEATGTSNWHMYDNKRQLVNPRTIKLNANTNQAEYSYQKVDFLSNGFQILDNDTAFNESGATYLYIAFAADPDTEAPTVAKSFFTTTYDGTGADGNTVTGFGFKPGLLWLKRRNSAADHWLFDIVRGPFKLLESSTNDIENNRTTSVASFDDDGFTIDNDTAYNNTSDDYIAWAWKADDNEPTINTEGSIDSIVSANANAGFSIVKWDGTGAINTVGHGLSSAPEMILIKDLDSSSDWQVYHTSIGNGDKLVLNSTAAASSTTRWDSTSPTATVFTLRDIGLEGGLIAYCFHSVSGYSKFGSYSGSSSSVTVTTGFQPDFVLIKNVDGVRRWAMFDSVRNNFGSYLDASDSLAEQTDSEIEISVTSTGFVLPAAANYTINSSGYDYIYMAFKIN